MSLLIAGLVFSKGQIIFGICFAIVFIVFTIFSYIKDAKNHTIYYKNTAKHVAIALIATITILIVSKYI